MSAQLVDQVYYPIDYDEVISAYIYEQFKESPNLRNYINAISESVKELQDVFIDILNCREVTNAFGQSLNTVGELVGQSRPVYDSNITPFFGFVDTTGAPGPIVSLGMGTLSDTSVGGSFRFLGQPASGLTSVNDIDYRTFIATQIESNIFQGSTNSLLQAIESFLYSPFIGSNGSLVRPPSELEAGALPFAFDDATGAIYPDPHRGFGDAEDPLALGGFFGDASVEKRIYVKITENYEVGSRGIQIRFYAKLTAKTKSFLKLNDILPKIAGIRYTYQDDNGVF